MDSFPRLPYRNIIHEVDRQEDGIFFTFSNSQTALVQSISDLGYFVVVYIQGVSSWSEKSKYFDERTFQHIIRLGAQELDNRVLVGACRRRFEFVFFFLYAIDGGRREDDDVCWNAH
ncbi:hypothetical protein AN477_07140 [Alicyclobacillus ferrooxydans]|uniref:Uncharacterized protein n=1 Tax=Alicyclobacillus ferrooxydans TaxID=471514 RepID=A0A0P9EZ77_9BACL|nr:hypothetical protein AN477_07140 [Alicyclobacillus ferrooxydans]